MLNCRARCVGEFRVVGLRLPMRLDFSHLGTQGGSGTIISLIGLAMMEGDIKSNLQCYP